MLVFSNIGSVMYRKPIEYKIFDMRSLENRNPIIRFLFSAFLMEKRSYKLKKRESEDNMNFKKEKNI